MFDTAELNHLERKIERAEERGDTGLVEDLKYEQKKLEREIQLKEMKKQIKNEIDEMESENKWNLNNQGFVTNDFNEIRNQKEDLEKAFDSRAGKAILDSLEEVNMKIWTDYQMRYQEVSDSIDARNKMFGD